jgi:hypothetical protein
MADATRMSNLRLVKFVGVRQLIHLQRSLPIRGGRRRDHQFEILNAQSIMLNSCQEESTGEAAMHACCRLGVGA